MIPSDFEHYSIDNFSRQEIEETGASINDVNLFLMQSMQSLRDDLGRVIVLLYGGLTTGHHASYQHPNGTACDFCLREGDGDISISSIHYAVQRAGFKAFGVYWNGTAFSFHVDLGPNIRSWLWWKRHRENKWKKETLYRNPILLTQ